MTKKQILPIASTVLIVLIITAAGFFGCRTPEHISGDGKIVIGVSVEPCAYLIERIGGERVHPEVLVPTGKEPETYQPSPDKIAALSHIQVFFRTGIPVEEMLLPKLQSISGLPTAKIEIVDLRDGLALLPMSIHHHESEKKNHADNHAHGNTDPHIWFAPELLKQQAETVLKTLERIDPNGLALYQANYNQFVAEIESLQSELKKQLEAANGSTIYVFHPTYGYFCKEFGLKQMAIEFEGKTPTPLQIAGMIEETKKSKTKIVIFVQPEFNQSPAAAVAEAVGGKIVVHSTLERNVLQSIKRFADLIVQEIY
jgi:zinc transport system substrate-binding protein